ncbi:hypothetical protein AB0O16_11460 [Microbacterium sp. NPDC089180]|uniref:Uncharacterized protein n=1 Tax=Microbacterium galbum TaxID=3075994 RepID=A0ABU3T3I7_9MICO|nr:hypothetical protein [Microbacterium sp. KSW4-17]MDU0365927.1 hypothetical protein [Microbacterium sp. KSW4-17]
MSTPTFPQTPSEPSAPTPAEPTTPAPSEPTVPLPPETQPAPAGGVGDEAKGSDAAGAFAEDDDEAIGSAETVADNAVEEAVVDAVDPGGRPD